MKDEVKKEEHRLFDQAHVECCRCRKARRQISEAMRRIRCWFNKEFRAVEPLPKEFKDFVPPSEQERMKNLWGKYL